MYKSEYPNSYEDGIVNKSITISRVAQDLLNENTIENVSSFLNDLIIDALQEKGFYERRHIKMLNKIKEDMKKAGMEMEFNITRRG
jgi:hypothetical protein